LFKVRLFRESGKSTLTNFFEKLKKKIEN